MPAPADGNVCHFFDIRIMNYDEQALSFSCQGQTLFGVLSVPEQIHPRAVLMVVGGPQYRVGSHRQFTLLARSLAEQGIATLRFDYRGMGDSEGEARDFEAVGEDLRCAIDELMATLPGVREVAIWGLCDAASAALFYAAGDARVSAVALLNPWVRTSAGLAKATLKHYYRQRLLDPALWKKIASGRFDFGAAGRSFARLIGAARSAPSAPAQAKAHSAPDMPPADAPLPERMLFGLTRFQGKILLMMSGNDLTAQEFNDVVKASPAWQRALGTAAVTRHTLAEADHTFSRAVWRDQVASWTATWVKSW